MPLLNFLRKLIKAPAEKAVVDKQASAEAAHASLQNTKKEARAYLEESGFYKGRTFHITSRSSGPSAWRTAPPPRIPAPYGIPLPPRMPRPQQTSAPDLLSYAILDLAIMELTAPSQNACPSIPSDSCSGSSPDNCTL